MCDDDYWYWYCDNSTPEETAECHHILPNSPIWTGSFGK